jgi:hypothetical protein
MTSLRNYVITIYTLSAKAVCVLSAALAAVLFAGCSPRVATSFWRIGTPADSTREGYAVLYEGAKMRHCYPITEWKTTDEKEDVYHSLHHHGVAVESELMAYRIYFDKKQTIDPYCKRKPQLELAQSYWYPNDSLLAAGYGDDILRVSGTVGVGSVKYWNGKKHTHIENIVERSQRIVKQTRNKATIEIAVKGWQIPLNNSQLDDFSQLVNLSVQYTMKAGHRDLRCDVTLSEAVEGLCTGVQTIPAKGGKDTVTIVLSNGVLLASWGTDWPVNDSAKYAKETVGLAVFIPKQFAGSLVHDKQNNLCLLKLSASRHQHSAHFYLTCCGATKENHPVARTAEEWYAYLRKWAKGLK